MSTNQPGKPRVKFIDEAGTDTEAHAVRIRNVEDAGTETTETTEAHVAKFRGVTEDDNAEGHGIRGKGG
jgi:hypothetical protein